jgi:dsDNA-specific endonuclease/ATPase MutS2
MTKKLPPEDLDLWMTHTKDVKRIPKTKRIVDTSSKPKKPVIQPHLSKRILEMPFTETPPGSLGRREMRRVKIEAKVDLHGMTLDQAYGALERFLLTAQIRGVRTILVITGKGSLSADVTIRSMLRVWLTETPLRNLVSYVHHPAKPEDGGQGAFYVGVKKRT